MDLVKDHKELYDKNIKHFKDKARKECLWEKFANRCKVSVRVCKTWFESQRTHYSKLMQWKSGQAPIEMTERQNWIQDKFGFLRSHIRRKGLSKSSDFKSKARGASASIASTHNISRVSTNTDSLEISMRSTDTTLQPQHVTSPAAASGCFSVDQQVADQFTQMRTMLSSFLGQKQETTTCTAFCNYLASDMEGFVEKDFHTLRNKAVKLLSSIQSRAEEAKQVVSPCNHNSRHFRKAQVQL